MMAAWSMNSLKINTKASMATLHQLLFGFKGFPPKLIPDDDAASPTQVQSPPPVAPKPAPKPASAGPAPKRPRQQPRRTKRRSPRRHGSSRATANTATTLFTDNFTTHFAMHGTAVNPDTGGIAEYKELSNCSDGTLWQGSNADDECSKALAQIPTWPRVPTLYKADILKHKKPTYVRVVCADWPEKTNPKGFRWTAGGNKVKYTGNVTTQTADIQTAKCLFNSVVSTPNGRFMTLDLKDFYLCSDLPMYKYVRIPMHLLPPVIIELYELKSKIVNGYIYAEVRKGMYSLPQAGKLANDRLRNFLQPFG
jgi:hypothetical protein